MCRTEAWAQCVVSSPYDVNLLPLHTAATVSVACRRQLRTNNHIWRIYNYSNFLINRVILKYERIITICFRLIYEMNGNGFLRKEVNITRKSI